MLLEPVSPLRIVVLLSGGGTTLANLLRTIKAGELDAEVALVISSSAKAGGLHIAAQAGVPTHVMRPHDFGSPRAFSQAVFDACRAVAPHVAAMAGYLSFVEIPPDFAGRVLNIHPSLIPAFCGAGYYGRRVHAAVLEYGAKVSGCTVHLVDNEYDHGPVILQRTVDVLDDDTPELLAARVFAEECLAYPEALRRYASGRMRLDGRRVRLSTA